MKLLKNNSRLVTVLILIVSIFSCSDADEYLKYTEGGEISYTGKIDSLKIFPGRNRVMLEGLIISDPKVTQLRAYWNSKADSIVVPIVKTTQIDTVSAIIEGLDENIYNFEIRTFDADENSSIPQFATQEVFGERYQESLNNRLILKSSLSSDLSLTIEFATMDRTTGVYATEVVYTDGADVEQTLYVPIATNEIVIPNYKEGSKFSHHSLFLPHEESIDIFYSEQLSLQPEVVDFSDKIKNNKIPFQVSERSGRWGNLADWTTNDAAKNHGGYGGWDEWSTGIFNLESGWGSPIITNGKVYQTITLNAGTYVFKAHPRAKGTGIDSGYTLDDFVYLTVAEGNILPDSNAGILETDPLTLGFTRLVKTMSPNDAEVTFTITETKEISLGISTTQGNSRFCNIEAFTFLKKNI